MLNRALRGSLPCRPRRPSRKSGDRLDGLPVDRDRRRAQVAAVGDPELLQQIALQVAGGTPHPEVQLLPQDNRADRVQPAGEHRGDVVREPAGQLTGYGVRGDDPAADRVLAVDDLVDVDGDAVELAGASPGVHGELAALTNRRAGQPEAEPAEQRPAVVPVGAAPLAGCRDHLRDHPVAVVDGGDRVRLGTAGAGVAEVDVDVLRASLDAVVVQFVERAGRVTVAQLADALHKQPVGFSVGDVLLAVVCRLGAGGGHS